MKMKALIIDDEPLAHDVILRYAADVDFLDVVGQCYLATEGLTFLQKESVDLIFLDINMPKLSGFDFLKTIRQIPKVIVTSAYKEFALEGYELNVTDYLLKPFSFERFLKAINKVMENQTPVLVATSSPAPKDEKASFFLKGDKKIHQVHFDDILFIEAYGNYTKVFLAEEMIISHQKISSLEALLPASDFLRVHKSFIVATDKIKMIEGNRITIGTHLVPIGQTYKYLIKQLLRSE